MSGSTPAEARALAQDAYVFGFPLVYIAVQVDRSTAVTRPTGPLAPINQWGHFRTLPDASDRTVVGMNLDVLLSMANCDLGPEPLDGSHRYRLRFPGAPPVEQFWSIYLYKPDGFLVENPIDRYMLGSRSELAWGDDGSLTLAIQRDRPDDVPESNWLPGPADGPFLVVMRLYVPTPEIPAGTWQPPGIERIT